MESYLVKYIFRRILIIFPTILGITLVFFVIINLAPGGPIERKIQQLKFGHLVGGQESSQSKSIITTEALESLKKQYGFDKPLMSRYFLWLKNLAHFDFGESYTYGIPALEVITSRFPVSLQFGLTSFFLTYLISIPLGLFKAIKHKSFFDLSTSFVLFLAYSIPGFMLAIVLIVYFAGGNFFDIFPIGGLYSDQYESFSTWGKFYDRVQHFILPLICYIIGQFTVLTLIVKNSVLDEVKKDYIRTARAKGLAEKKVIFKHALKNALIPVVTGLGGFLTVFFSGSLLLEVIFQLDGIGLLSYKAVLERDYTVLMASTFLQTLLMLVGNLMSDIAYVLVDPRIDYK